MKAIGYIRVSTEEQALEGVSLDNQKERITAYCQYKGYELVDVIADEGISGGKNKARVGFISLLDTIERGDIEIVVLYSLERLSRDMLTLLSLERLLNEHDVQLHTIEGAVDTSNPDGFMSFAMKAFLGEMERRQIKHRTAKAMQHKKRHGEVVGSIPYGNIRAGKELAVSSEELAVKGMVNVLYGKGYNLSGICRTLKAQGIKTRAGRDFDGTQVKRMIDGYQEKYQRTNTALSQNIRTFIEAIA
ncbi:MAG: recombinase family protein [Nitrospirae bacterium]|nr:recombinase family protein [Nitrospirota bacterium]